MEKYAPRRITYKRSAAAVWGNPGEPLGKRPKVSGDPVTLSGAAEIEAACGDQYRKEVSDLGIGDCVFNSGIVFVLCPRTSHEL